jgi:hypothetical protein
MINKIDQISLMVLMESMPGLGLVTNLTHMIAKKVFSESSSNQYSRYLASKTFTTLCLQLIPFYALFNTGSSVKQAPKEVIVQPTCESEPKLESEYEVALNKFRQNNPCMCGDVLILSFFEANYAAHPEYIDHAPEHLKQIIEMFIPVWKQPAQKAVLEASETQLALKSLIQTRVVELDFTPIQSETSIDQISPLCLSGNDPYRLTDFFDTYSPKRREDDFEDIEAGIDGALVAVRQGVQNGVVIVAQGVLAATEKVDEALTNVLGEEGVNMVVDAAALAVSYAVGTAADVNKGIQVVSQMTTGVMKQASDAASAVQSSAQDYIDNPDFLVTDLGRAAVAGAGQVASVTSSVVGYALNFWA